MERIVVILVAFLFSFNVFANPAELITLDQKFGEVSRGEVLEHIFILPQAGEITSMLVSCDCLKVEKIEGRNQLSVKLIFDTSSYSGLSSVYCVVFTDKANYKLSLTAFVFSGK